MQVWDQPVFAAVLKRELEALPADSLPLQQGLSFSSSVAAAPFTVLVNSVEEHDGSIRVQAGIMYQGETGGCSCAGDPGIESAIDEYCEVSIEIDKASARAAVKLADS
ncbi:MAG: hypothetical protein KJ795_02745 [Gammaproteobacteria bacterium]|nr:hypothetical protein [Gammaproteobacteria bacterium]MBU1777592.1 hypothetical protein [Gammaproteobacteria bacterium]MBU1967686.1 hypothetical protein [Gammaproteobacteria bacterium]